MLGCRTLLDLLRQAAAQKGESGIGYLAENAACRFESYADLMTKAIKRTATLRECGLMPGDKLILSPGDNESFIVTFWACLFGGAVPVPLASPSTTAARSDATVERLHGVWEVLERPRILLGERPPAEWEFPVATILVERELAAASAAMGDCIASPSPESPAFIQFSSGSTAQPKGVVLSHGNVLTNLHAISVGLALQTHDVAVNWLPLHHDMGLVGFHLAGIAGGVRQYHLETTSFIRRPLLWLDLLSQYKATITAAPNFSQSLLLSRLENAKRAHWDLSSVRLVMNGAEPISVHLMQRFVRALAPYGLRDRSMFPCYGLAEATLAVCFPRLDEPTRVETLDRSELQTSRKVARAKNGHNAIQFVSVGFPVHGCEVRIADEDDRELSDNAVGHIQIRGENVTKGYYGGVAAPDNASLFSADGWLRTGDMGFRCGGRHCVTGRIKDILIVAGQNLYAHDIEQAAQRVDGVVAGRVAVCGCYEPLEEREKLVVFLATPNAQRDAARFRKVRRQIQNEIGVRPDALVPLPASSFPKTTSGKLQRFILREGFERGEFQESARQMEAWIEALPREASRQMPATTTEVLLQREWCEALGLPEAEVGIHDHFAELGGRSIHAAIIVERMETRLGVTLHSAELATRPTIAEIAEYIDRSARTKPPGARTFFRG